MDQYQMQPVPRLDFKKLPPEQPWTAPPDESETVTGMLKSRAACMEQTYPLFQGSTI